MRRQVERLLDARAERGSFLESPALGPTIEYGVGEIAEGPAAEVFLRPQRANDVRVVALGVVAQVILLRRVVVE